MLLTNFICDPDSRKPMYLQLCHFIREEIRKQHMRPGDRLPSIRKLARALGVSRTTVETCYSQLLGEGWLVSSPQRGHFVADLLPRKKQPLPPSAPEKKPCRYDFANNYIDGTTFPENLWRRHLKKVLADNTALTTYGDPQGEEALRQVLSRYSHDARGVVCSPEQIVVGAGIQSLLEILAALLADTLFPEDRAVAMENPGFPQAEEVFRRQGWDIRHFDVEDVTGEKGEKPASLLFLSPSNPYKGRSLTPAQRRQLLRWCRREDAYILEDDYNGEFRYFSTPVSSLQGMSDGIHIIYLGSFSRLLLPSLRISYMVLPPALLPAYRRLRPLYNQTSSTLEQLALAAFIEEGNLRRHVKRLRRLYAGKNALLRQALERHFGKRLRILAYESGLHIRIALKSRHTSARLVEIAERNGVNVLDILPELQEKGEPQLLLSFAGIAMEDIPPAVKLLAECWTE